MNPSQPTPSPTPEQPRPLVSTEIAGQLVPEQAQMPAIVEAASQPGGGASAAPVASMPAVPLMEVAVAAPPTSTAATPPPVMATPAIADDVDVIEKEWVDHATKIIEATNQDPYVEEEAIEDLQVDYMKKRYGKDVKKDLPPVSG